MSKEYEVSRVSRVQVSFLPLRNHCYWQRLSEVAKLEDFTPATMSLTSAAHWVHSWPQKFKLYQVSGQRCPTLSKSLASQLAKKPAPSLHGPRTLGKGRPGDGKLTRRAICLGPDSTPLKRLMLGTPAFSHVQRVYREFGPAFPP